MRLLIILVILLAAVGCRAKTLEPAVIPVIEQPTYQGVTQYDYKAGPPNVYTNPAVNNTESVNPYLVQQGLDWSKYFPKLPDAPSTGTTSGRGGGWYYAPPARVVFWSGSATVTVQ
jgi:hypothetical protein